VKQSLVLVESQRAGMARRRRPRRCREELGGFGTAFLARDEGISRFAAAAVSSGEQRGRFQKEIHLNLLLFV
jgi:hypothetical protein